MLSFFKNLIFLFIYLLFIWKTWVGVWSWRRAWNGGSPEFKKWPENGSLKASTHQYYFPMWVPLPRVGQNMCHLQKFYVMSILYNIVCWSLISNFKAEAMGRSTRALKMDLRDPNLRSGSMWSRMRLDTAHSKQSCQTRIKALACPCRG